MEKGGPKEKKENQITLEKVVKKRVTKKKL